MLLKEVDFSCLTDGIIEWRPYQGEDLCCKFKKDDWNKIVFDVFSDLEWKQFVNEYSDIVNCYTLYLCSTNEILGFVYLYLESFSERVISIHGGGWLFSLRIVKFYYRGMFCLLKYLLENGIKVRTYCLKSNKRAQRFIKSIGFVKYKEGINIYYFWINKKRLIINKVYKSFGLN